jgi:hypothetical protein
MQFGILSLATRVDPSLHPRIIIILRELVAQIILSRVSHIRESRRRTLGMAKKKKGKKKR